MWIEILLKLLTKSKSVFTLRSLLSVRVSAQAEKVNGRAAMIGYVLALVVDQLSGVGVLDQQNSFLGKVLLHITVFGLLLIRTSTDVSKYKNLFDEATFYDKQWASTWEGVQRPSEEEK